jgi:hypothetical protein
LKVLFSHPTLILAHFPSRTPKNHQATMKTRYCGHLYSSLLRKWTWWDHRDQVSYYMEGGLKGTEGSPPGRVGGLVGHPVSTLLLWASPWVCSVAMAINRPFGVEMTNVHTACLFGSSGWSLRRPSLMGLSNGESLSRLVGLYTPPMGYSRLNRGSRDKGPLVSPVCLSLMVGWSVLCRVKGSCSVGRLTRRGRAWWDVKLVGFAHL